MCPHPLMRVLLSCYYFSPYRGGEAAVGWKYATGLAALGHEVTVLYGDLSALEPMKADVDRKRQEGGFPENLHPVHISADPLARRIHDLHSLPGLWFLYYPAYRRWQRQAFETARELHSARAFDLAHQVTIIGYREPGLLWRLGIPFFWGPINGADPMPWGFIPSFSWKGRCQHALRNLANAVQMRLPGRSRRAAKHARKIWTVTREDRRMVENLWGLRADCMIETGATPLERPPVRSRKAGETLRLIWCGIMEARKSLDLILRAMAELPADVSCTLDVIGDGVERIRWECLANRLGLTGRVRWHGRVSHEDAQRLMGEGHVLVHSSVKEGTPHVVLEAMAQAMPVICHDACGMGVAVNEKAGIKIPMLDPKTSVRGFRHAIAVLWRAPGRLASLSAGAHARAVELCWNNTIARIDTAYRSNAGPSNPS